LLNLLPHDRVARADELLHCLLSDLAAELLQLLEEIRAHAHLIRRILAQHLKTKEGRDEEKRKTNKKKKKVSPEAPRHALAMICEWSQRRAQQLRAEALLTDELDAVRLDALLRRRLQRRTPIGLLTARRERNKETQRQRKKV
jgi:hypothetical protein